MRYLLAVLICLLCYIESGRAFETGQVCSVDPPGKISPPEDHNNCITTINDYIFEFVKDRSSSTAGENGHIDVLVKGGKLPIHWTVEGTGFYTDETHQLKEDQDGGKNLRIYLKDACGPATITAKEFCGKETTFTVIGSKGTWRRVFYGPSQSHEPWPTDPIGPSPRQATYEGYSGGIGHTWVAYDGKYRIRQGFQFSYRSWESPSPSPPIWNCDWHKSEWYKLHGSEVDVLKTHHDEAITWFPQYVDWSTDPEGFFVATNQPDGHFVSGLGGYYEPRCFGSGSEARVGTVVLGAFSSPISDLIIEEWTCQ
jgi:hypothetical protein